MSIWLSNDIRGKVPDELNSEFAYQLGVALVQRYNPSKVVIALDTRSSSEGLAQWLYRGIKSMALTTEVICLGKVPSPVLYALGDGDINVMITASHNPEPYNGFKICFKEGVPLGKDNGLHDLKHLVKEIVPNKGPFFFDNLDIPDGKETMEIYAERFLYNRKDPKFRQQRIFLVDCANAVGNKYLPLLRKQYPDHIWIGLNTNTEGHSHEANPLLDYVWKDIARNTSELLTEDPNRVGNIVGIMFDGDGDRIGMYDIDRIPGDTLGAVYVQHRKPKMVAYDTRCNFRIPRYFKKNKIKSVETKVGHTFIKQVMRTNETDFGMELSGHYYFKEHNYCDAPLLMLAEMVDILSECHDSLFNICEPFLGVWTTNEINYQIPMPEGKEMVCNNVANLFTDVDYISYLHGVKVHFKDGSWVLSRASGTEPVLRIIVEGTTEERKNEILDTIRRFIEGVGGTEVDVEDTREDDKLMEKQEHERSKKNT